MTDEEAIMAGFYSANVADGIKEAIAKEKKDMKVFNVMLLGKTGVGKSTLINNLFSERIAQTGIGKPVTQDIRLSTSGIRYTRLRTRRGQCPRKAP